MKKSLIVIAGLIALSSCGKKTDFTKIVGNWKMVDINHPLFEEDFKKRKEAIESQTKVDFGKSVYWHTNDLDSIKKLETKMIEDEYKMSKESFFKMGFNFLDTNTVIRFTRDIPDTNHYRIAENNLILTPINGPIDKFDTLLVDELTSNKLVMRERFMKSFVTVTFEK